MYGIEKRVRGNFFYLRVAARLQRRRQTRQVRLASRWLRRRVAFASTEFDQILRVLYLEGVLGMPAMSLLRQGPRQALQEADRLLSQKFGQKIEPEWTTLGDTGWYRKTFDSVQKIVGFDDAMDLMQEVMIAPGDRNKFWLAGSQERFDPARTTPQKALKKPLSWVLNLAKDALHKVKVREKHRVREMPDDGGIPLVERGSRSELDLYDVELILLEAITDRTDPDGRVVMKSLQKFWNKNDPWNITGQYANWGSIAGAARALGKKKSAVLMRWYRLMKDTRSYIRKEISRNPQGKLATALVGLMEKVGIVAETGQVTGEAPGVSLFNEPASRSKRRKRKPLEEGSSSRLWG